MGLKASQYYLDCLRQRDIQMLPFLGGLGGSVKHLTSAQVMISRFVSLSPASVSVLTAQNLEPALDSVSVSVSVSLSAPPLLTFSLSHTQINKLLKKSMISY